MLVTHHVYICTCVCLYIYITSGALLFQKAFGSTAVVFWSLLLSLPEADPEELNSAFLLMQEALC